MKIHQKLLTEQINWQESNSEIDCNFFLGRKQFPKGFDDKSSSKPGKYFITKEGLKVN
jgi:hypothetical protein